MNKRRRLLGRRGATLVLMGILWFALGWATTFSPSHITFSAFHFAIPGALRGAMWCGGAILAFIFAARRHDWPGFVGLLVMPGITAASCLTSWFLSLCDLGGYDRAWYSFIFYAGMVAWVLITAGWPEPAHFEDLDTHHPIGVVTDDA